MENNKQMSDKLITSFFLLMSGGLQDAYTYFLRGKVFANAQTGNYVIMVSYILQSKIGKALPYIISILSFAVGIFISESIHRKFKKSSKIHWRQIVVIAEIILLFFVGFLKTEYNFIANSLVSFVCAMQLQAFKKVNGNAYASTMCIGNTRSAVEQLCTYVYTKDKIALKKFIEYSIVIFAFVIGAGIGYLGSTYIGIKAIWLSCLLLFVSNFLMCMQNKD